MPLIAALGLATRGEAQSDSLAAVRRAPAEMLTLMRAHLFDSRQLEDSAARQILAATDSLAQVATDRRSFATGVNRLWRRGPFSHLRLDVARMPADVMAAFVDTMRAGPESVRLRWIGRVAVLEVNTMMGVDTRDAISAAYREIVGKSATGLVIDLRRNDGGAFAVVPLVGHAIERPVDGGVFFGRRWSAEHAQAPSSGDVGRMPPWRGWSVRRFWDDVEAQGVLRIQFEPMAPHYGGPVIVLTSESTASAAELAVDALLANARAQVFGERTAGQMLSQRMFDVPGGLQLSLPIADYHSARMGRIEGVGVQPTRPMPAAAALDSALARLGATATPGTP
jgi:hypothetical protein